MMHFKGCLPLMSRLNFDFIGATFKASLVKHPKTY